MINEDGDELQPGETLVIIGKSLIEPKASAASLLFDTETRKFSNI